MHNRAIMASEVRHLVDPGQTYPLVRLAGMLDARTAPEVRSTLLGVLAAQPEAVVVDVGDLRVAQNDAVGVLRDLHRDTADWPAARLALCDPGSSAVWQDSGWPIWPDTAQAFAALGTPDHGHRLSVEMEPVVSAARRSRELITKACDRWGCPELAGPACIIATELVNNVVVHAHTPMVLLLALHGEGMSVAVRDESATAPSFTGEPVAPTAYGGRGMLLIDSIATRWGSLLLNDGKVVWAVLDGDEPV